MRGDGGHAGLFTRCQPRQIRRQEKRAAANATCLGGSLALTGDCVWSSCVYLRERECTPAEKRR
ncbi:hypothetical protein X777_13131 [Ooceraea biroi]|uniref:Uncharacterized protein n=1 Tax=Ooceraea biroi TaxID=2015173 RepID=A0A026X0K5_OOCBI|nr:hypothetical protein X777_13131 [Ooceraea biroi]